MNNKNIRKAILSDIPAIWEIIQQAIQKRKEEGSDQWQNGYPNPEVLKNDIENDFGYVLISDGVVTGYTAVMINDEPAYDTIEGEWLTTSDFVVFHRVAISKNHLGKGLARKLFEFYEKFAIEHNIKSVKADTNHDNGPMLHLFEKMGYTMCGTVYMGGSPRLAYEKVLTV